MIAHATPINVFWNHSKKISPPNWLPFLVIFKITKNCIRYFHKKYRVLTKLTPWIFTTSTPNNHLQSRLFKSPPKHQSTLSVYTLKFSLIYTTSPQLPSPTQSPDSSSSKISHSNPIRGLEELARCSGSRTGEGQMPSEDTVRACGHRVAVTQSM